MPLELGFLPEDFTSLSLGTSLEVNMASEADTWIRVVFRFYCQFKAVFFFNHKYLKFHWVLNELLVIMVFLSDNPKLFVPS